jgi:hypothetical protein
MSYIPESPPTLHLTPVREELEAQKTKEVQRAAGTVTWSAIKLAVDFVKMDSSPTAPRSKKMTAELQEKGLKILDDMFEKMADVGEAREDWKAKRWSSFRSPPEGLSAKTRQEAFKQHETYQMLRAAGTEDIEIVGRLSKLGMNRCSELSIQDMAESSKKQDLTTAQKSELNQCLRDASKYKEKAMEAFKSSPVDLGKGAMYLRKAERSIKDAGALIKNAGEENQIKSQATDLSDRLIVLADKHLLTEESYPLLTILSKANEEIAKSQSKVDGKKVQPEVAQQHLEKAKETLKIVKTALDKVEALEKTDIPAAVDILQSDELMIMAHDKKIGDLASALVKNEAKLKSKGVNVDELKASIAKLRTEFSELKKAQGTDTFKVLNQKISAHIQDLDSKLDPSLKKKSTTRPGFYI